jgi:hypothetical protein
LAFDPAAARAWLDQPGGDGLTRAQALGVEEGLFGRGQEHFLATVADVLAARPDGLHRRPDISDVLLWPIPDDEVPDQGPIIIVELSNGVRLASRRQNITDFADRDQRGGAALLSALAHLTAQARLLVDTYVRSRPGPVPVPDATGPAAVSGLATPQGPVFSEEQVSQALNSAADEVLDAVSAGPDGLRDGINLVVNAALSYLTGQAVDLREVVDQNYDEDYTTVLGWIEAAV